MSNPIQITSTPMQITDGTNSAHLTVIEGFVEYADSEISTAWHPLRSHVMSINSPWAVWLRVNSGVKAKIIVSRISQ